MFVETENELGDAMSEPFKRMCAKAGLVVNVATQGTSYSEEGFRACYNHREMKGLYVNCYMVAIKNGFNLANPENNDKLAKWVVDLYV